MIKIKKIIFVNLLLLLFTIGANSKIEDGLYATVGNKAITRSDLINEMKILLILNNESFSDSKRERLEKSAIKLAVDRSIKKNEIENFDFLTFNEDDLKKELIQIANRINVDVETLKNICASNDLDFNLIEDQIKTELLWNSLIFHLYKDRLSINLSEIDEQLKMIQNKKDLNEYLISEIIINPLEKDKLDIKIKEIKNRIENEGFENVAIDVSISKTSGKGGDLGWVRENVISKKMISKIAATPVGSISEPIILPNGILFFKVRNKRTVEKTLSLEEEKNLLVVAEKTKILQMHSLSHFDKAKRSIAIKFFQ